MSDVVYINTENSAYQYLQNSHGDPHNHLGPEEWVQKQIDWANQSEPSGLGLIEPISKLNGDLIGVEIGVCLGSTTEALLQQIPNIKKMYAVDNYPSFIDWNGGNISEERQSLMKAYAFKRLSPFADKVDFCYQSSVDFAKRFPDKEYFDFVFIDGDHSEDASYLDFCNFYPLVKKGGIFAGHDIVLPDVEKSLKRFFGETFSKIIRVSNNAWYLIKE